MQRHINASSDHQCTALKNETFDCYVENNVSNTQLDNNNNNNNNNRLTAFYRTTWVSQYQKDKLLK